MVPFLNSGCRQTTICRGMACMRNLFTKSATGPRFNGFSNAWAEEITDRERNPETSHLRICIHSIRFACLVLPRECGRNRHASGSQGRAPEAYCVIPRVANGVC